MRRRRVLWIRRKTVLIDNQTANTVRDSSRSSTHCVCGFVVCTYFAATMSKSFNRLWAENNIYRTQSILISIFCAVVHGERANPLGEIYYNLCLSPLFSFQHLMRACSIAFSSVVLPFNKMMFACIVFARTIVAQHGNGMWLSWRKILKTPIAIGNRL